MTARPAYQVKTRNRKIIKPGELELIESIRKRFPRKRREIIKGIGDDAMVLKGGFVISTDSFAEGVHFDLAYFNFYQLGYRSMAASVSDLAAMASEPVCCLVSLYLPKGIQKRNVRDLYRGFRSVCETFRMDVSGGDIVASPFLGVTLTVIGYARAPLLRSGARPGDGLYLTGFPGLSEAGRIVLKGKYPRRCFPDSVRRHLFPVPRVNEARILRRYCRCGIDTSDGLSTDAWHLAEESKAGVVIEADSLPVHPELMRLKEYRRIDIPRFILSSGEDFELLVGAPGIPAIKDLKVTRIGRFIQRRGLWMEQAGKSKRIDPTGYEHLK